MKEEKTINVNTEAQASTLEKAALEVFGKFVETAKENFYKDGEVSPVVFIGIDTNDKLGMIIMPAHEFMKSIESKDLLSQLMIKIGKNRHVICIMMITEAWMSKFEKKDKDGKTVKMTQEEINERYADLPPSKDPDRIEQLMCTFESENIQKSLFFRIVRDPELKLEDYPTGSGSMQGRFANVLRDMKKVRDN